MPGPGKTPTKLKLIRGNPGKRALPDREPEYTPGDLAAPDHLQGEALKLWPKYAAALDANGLLTDVSREVLAGYCDLWGSYIEKRKAGGEPDLKILQQVRLMAREFGFTPSSQASVVVPGKKQSDGKERYFG